MTSHSASPRTQASSEEVSERKPPLYVLTTSGNIRRVPEASDADLRERQREIERLEAQLAGAVVLDDAAIERAADALAAKLHWMRDLDRARELARAALHAAAGGQ